MELPPDVADPIFLCELAEHLHMPIGELGQRMSNYELCVIWPQYFAYKHREAERQVDKQRQEDKRRRR